MQVKLGMPEVLVVFSLMMFSQSFNFSVIAFCLGIFSRLCTYLIDYGTEIKKAEAINQSAEDLGTAFKDVLSGFTQK